MKSIALALAFALGLFACSSDSSSGTTSSGGGATQGSASSCDLSADVGYCEDFSATAPKDEAKNNCASANSTLGYHGVANESGPCPTANVVASCNYTTANGVVTVYRYYSPKFTKESAATNCKALPGGGGQISGG